MSGQLIQLRAQTPTLLTKKQLAAHLGRSERWIELAVRDRGMPVVEGTDRLGRRRYSLVAVEAWIDAGRPRPKLDRLTALEARVEALEAELRVVGE